MTTLYKSIGKKTTKNFVHLLDASEKEWVAKQTQLTTVRSY